jgi:hypothetical protein
VKPHNLSNRFRQARMQRFLSLVAPLMSKGPVRILDIGGTASYWHALPGLYRAPNVEITICNLSRDEFDDGNLRVRHGNACSLPFTDMSFDVVHSNSVIEHVGHWPEMQAMASEVRRLAPVYFVQTPNYWFPLEPHYRLPFVQFLPKPARAFVVDALRHNPASRPASQVVGGIQLIAAHQMRALFPDAKIERERFFGMAKSLIAVRG